MMKNLPVNGNNKTNYDDKSQNIHEKIGTKKQMLTIGTVSINLIGLRIYRFKIYIKKISFASQPIMNPKFKVFIILHC